MRSARLIGLLGGLILSIASDGALAQCGPAAIGTSRRIEIDTSGGPRFGNNQYPSPDLLKPGVYFIRMQNAAGLRSQTYRFELSGNWAQDRKSVV